MKIRNLFFLESFSPFTHVIGKDYTIDTKLSRCYDVSVMALNFEVLVILVLLVWLGVLTFLFLKMFFHYQNLAKVGKGKNLQEVLDELLKDTNEAKKNIDVLSKMCDRIEKDSISHIQKIGR